MYLIRLSEASVNIEVYPIIEANPNYDDTTAYEVTYFPTVCTEAEVSTYYFSASDCAIIY